MIHIVERKKYIRESIRKGKTFNDLRTEGFNFVTPL